MLMSLKERVTSTIQIPILKVLNIEQNQEVYLTPEILKMATLSRIESRLTSLVIFEDFKKMPCLKRINIGGGASIKKSLVSDNHYHHDGSDWLPPKPCSQNRGILYDEAWKNIWRKDYHLWNDFFPFTGPILDNNNPFKKKKNKTLKQIISKLKQK